MDFPPPFKSDRKKLCDINCCSRERKKKNGFRCNPLTSCDIPIASNQDMVCKVTAELDIFFTILLFSFSSSATETWPPALSGCHRVRHFLYYFAPCVIPLL